MEERRMPGSSSDDQDQPDADAELWNRSRLMLRAPRQLKTQFPRREKMGRKAVLHIFTTYNNVLMTATDLTGAETIGKVSGGMITKKGSDKSSQFAAMRSAERMAELLFEKEFDQVIVKYRGAGGNRSPNAPGATAAIRALTRAGVQVSRIEDVTSIPTDGTKKKGGRRGRRV